MTLLQRIYPPVPPVDGAARWLLFRGDEILLPVNGGSPLCDGTTEAPAILAVGDALYLGVFDGLPLLTGTVPGGLELPDTIEPAGLRSLLAREDAELNALASYAAQLIRWVQGMRFCPTCAQPLSTIEGTWGRQCVVCGGSWYPPVSPAIIVLIHSDDRILLTTKPGWGKRYSLVAGFVEPGETFEECVAREVFEEVGVAVDQIRYLSSQAWPFPHQIMVGFMARYTGGEIVIEAAELADAAWFHEASLPELPQPYTIARRIIEQWRSERSAQQGAAL